MLTKPSPPKLLNSVEELVQQDEIGYFIEIGARNENLGKDSPPGSTLRWFDNNPEIIRFNSLGSFQIVSWKEGTFQWLLCRKCWQNQGWLCLPWGGTKYAEDDIWWLWKNCPVQLSHDNFTHIKPAICLGIQGQLIFFLIQFLDLVSNSSSSFFFIYRREVLTWKRSANIYTI